MSVDNDLLEEIKTNAREDRARLKKVADKLADVVDDPDGDPLVQVGVAENLAKLSDALTRSNAQLVEVAKVQAKEGPDQKNEVERERARMYAELEGQRQ